MIVIEVQNSSARVREMFAASGEIASNAPCGSAPVLAIGSAEQTVPHRLWARLKDPAHFALYKDRSCPAPVPPRNMRRRGYRRRLGLGAHTVCRAGQSLATAGLPCDCAKTGAAVTGATIIASAITPYNFLVISMPFQGLWMRLTHSASVIIRSKRRHTAIC